MIDFELRQTGAEIQEDLDFTESLFPFFSETSTYEVGDIVRYQGKIYKCTSAIAIPEYWTGDLHWIECTVDELLAAIPEVEANPTMAGTEASLSGLRVGNTKYKVVTPTDVNDAINTAIYGAIDADY